MRFVLTALLLLLLALPSTSWGEDPVYMRCPVEDSYEIYRFKSDDEHPITRRSQGDWVPWCPSRVVLKGENLWGVCNYETTDLSVELDFMFPSYTSATYSSALGMSETQVLCSIVTPTTE